MVYETLDNRNMSEGLQVIFLYVNDLTGGLFVSLFVFAFFAIICLGSYYSQQRLNGEGSFPASFAVAGFSTVILTVLMSLIAGFIPTYTILIAIVVTVLGVLWLYMDSR